MIGWGNKSGFGDYWLGLTDEKTEDTFVWETSDLNASIGNWQSEKVVHWNKHEPNNAGGNEDCVQYHDGGLNDVSCSGTAQVMCRRGG